MGSRVGVKIDEGRSSSWKSGDKSGGSYSTVCGFAQPRFVPADGSSSTLGGEYNPVLRALILKMITPYRRYESVARWDEFPAQQKPTEP